MAQARDAQFVPLPRSSAPPSFGELMNLSLRELNNAREQQGVRMIVTTPVQPAALPRPRRRERGSRQPEERPQGRPRGRPRGSRGGNRRRRGRREDEDEASAGGEEPDVGGDVQEPERRELIKQTNITIPDELVIIRAFLGPATLDQTKCWLCRAWVTRSPQLSLKLWNKLAELYRDGLIECSPAVNALNCYRFFVIHIKNRANRRLKPGQQPIPEVSAADIYVHCSMHIKEPSNQHWAEMQELKTLKDGIARAMWKPVRTIEGDIIKVPKRKYIKPFLDTLARSAQHRKCDPRTFFGYNPVYSVSLSTANPFANQNRAWEVENLPDAMKLLTQSTVGVKPTS